MVITISRRRSQHDDRGSLMKVRARERSGYIIPGRVPEEDRLRVKSCNVWRLSLKIPSTFKGESVGAVVCRLHLSSSLRLGLITEWSEIKKHISIVRSAFMSKVEVRLCVTWYGPLIWHLYRSAYMVMPYKWTMLPIYSGHWSGSECVSCACNGEALPICLQNVYNCQLINKRDVK